MKNKVKIRKKNLMRAVDMLKILSHPLRLSILCNLLEGGEMTAGQLVRAESVRHSQSQVSQYLGILRDRGYVATRRQGQTIYYRIKDDTLRHVLQALHDIHCPA